MEFIIIPQLILIFSLFGILLILGRNFSRIKDVYEPAPGFSREENIRDRSLEEAVERIKKEEEKFKYLWRRMAKRINLRTAQEKYKQLLGAARIKLEKVLRKTRIGFLKLDSKLAVLIEKLKKRKEKNVSENPPRPPLVKRETSPTPLTKKNIGILGYSEIGEEERKIKKNIDPEKDVAVKKAKEIVSENSPGSLLQRGKSKEGEYLKAISDNPKNADAYWKLGILYSRKRNYRDALNCFKEIVKIKPNYEKAKKKIKDISEKMRK